MIIRLFLTCVLALPAMAQFSLTNHATLYVSPSGNNATAIRGRVDRPWFSISNAVWASQNGDRVLIGSGDFTNTLFYTNSKTSSMKLWSKTNVTIEGAGPATRVWGFGIGAHLQVSNCLGVTIRNFGIYGNAPAASAGVWVANGAVTAIDYCGSRDVTIEGMKFKDHPSFAIGTSDDLVATPARDIAIRGNWFENIGATSGVPGVVSGHDGQGVLINGDGFSVIDNTFTNCAGGIELYSNVQSIRNARIARNNILGVKWAGIFAPSSGSDSLTNCVIEENTFMGMSGPSALGADYQAMTFGIPMDSCRISRNMISGFAGGGNGISANIAICRRNLFDGNTFNGIGGNGLSMYDASESTNICHNTISRNVFNAIGGQAIQLHGMNNAVDCNMISNWGTNGATSAIRSYGGGAGAGTNIWNSFTGNRMFYGSVGISIESANCRTNRVIDNFSIGVGTPVSNTGTGTVVRDNTN